MSATTTQSRLTIDIPVDVKQRLRLVSAHHRVSLQEYLLETIETRLAQDWQELVDQEGLLAIGAQSDPVLAELWANDKDAAYDSNQDSA